MIITYHSHDFFKVQFGETVLAFNPISKDSKLKQTKFGADIALLSLNDRDYNGVENVTFGDKKPFVISGPGEYEVKGIMIKGFLSKSMVSGEPRINTVYLLTLENMNLCFLGALSEKELSKELKEAIDDVDILFTPIGGGEVLGPAEAYKLSVALEPKIIIPMHYQKEGKELKIFLKEGGSENLKAIDKLTLKRKDLEGKEGDIVVLSSD